MTADSWELDLKLDRDEFVVIEEALRLQQRWLTGQGGKESRSTTIRTRLERIDALLDRLGKEAP